MENYKTTGPKSGRSRLREVVPYERFQMYVLTSLPHRRSFGSTRNPPQRRAGTRDEPLRTSEGSLLRKVIDYER